MAEISPPPPKRRKVSELPKSQSTHVSERTISIYSWNVNGIGPFLERSIQSFFPSRKGSDALARAPSTSLRDVLRRYDWPTMLFLQEVKINPNDTATIRSLGKSVRSKSDDEGAEPDYDAHVTLPSRKQRRKGFGEKIYGVCSIFRKDFYDRHVAKLRGVEWDVEGRFLVIETKGDDEIPKLAIFNVYLVNGTNMPYKDPYSGESTGATRHDRKLRVHELFAAECAALQADGFGVIAAGDMNIARSALDGHPKLRIWPAQHCYNRADFEAKFFNNTTTVVELSGAAEGDSKVLQGQDHSLGMIDTFRHLHPHTRAYTYYPRSQPFGQSCDRVDMILASDTLKEHLTIAGMHETPQDRGPSDHVPLFALFSFDQTLS